MNILSYLLLILPLSLFFSVTSQKKDNACCVVVAQGITVNYQAIEELFPQQVVVQHISYHSDSCLQESEFFYLLGFEKGAMINATDVIKAVELFIRKNKYESIACEVVCNENNAYITFHFSSTWTCNKVKVHGIFQGKNNLLRHYLIEPGERFDIQKHELSLVKIKEALSHEGYYNAWIHGELDYDTKTKEVTVHIRVTKGKIFYVSDVVVALPDCANEHYQMVHDYAYKHLSHALLSKPAQKKLLDQCIAELKCTLAHKGFLHTACMLKEKVNMKKGTVQILITIIVHEKRSFIFFGNHFFSHKQLLDSIVNFGRSVWLIPSTLLAQEIVRVYKEKGFWQCEVITQEKKDQSIFIITEGRRAVIKKVELRYVFQFDRNYLVKQCFTRLLKKKLYDASLYDEAINALRALYTQKGFLHFQVLAHDFVPVGDNEYSMVVTVDEKEPVTISSVIIEGYPQLCKQGPCKDLCKQAITPSDPIFEKQRAWLVTHFQQQGYVHPRVRPQLEMEDGKTVMRFIVDPGEQVCFGKTVVLGSNRFPFKYILASLDYQSGQLWNPENIRQSFMRFKELEIFDTIQLTPDYTYKGEKKPIIVKLRNDDRYEVRARAGFELQHVRKYQTFSGVTYKIGGTALMKNPFNCGDQIRFDFDCVHSHKEIIARYRRLFFFKVPLATTFQGYIISYKQPAFIGSANDIYFLRQRGFFAAVQRKAQKVDGEIKAGFEWMSTSVKDELIALSVARAIEFEPRLLDLFIPFFFIEPTVMIDNLDNPLNPFRGTLTVVSVKALAPLKDKYQSSAFFKILLEQSCFVPLGRMVWALRVRAGHIFRRDLRATMPSERFYLGGSHSLRGYEIDLAPPLGIFVDENGHEQIVPKGGRSLFNANIELRFPLFKAVGGVLFQDIGALSSTLFANVTSHMLAATGFGIRVFSPIGPLRFDIGWRWKKQLSLERRFAWFLTFGQAF